MTIHASSHWEFTCHWLCASFTVSKIPFSILVSNGHWRSPSVQSLEMHTGKSWTLAYILYSVKLGYGGYVSLNSAYRPVPKNLINDSLKTGLSVIWLSELLVNDSWRIFSWFCVIDFVYGRWGQRHLLCVAYCAALSICNYSSAMPCCFSACLVLWCREVLLWVWVRPSVFLSQVCYYSDLGDFSCSRHQLA